MARSVPQILREACADPAVAAAALGAKTLLDGYVDNAPRLPGCGTVERLAYRIYLGQTVEEAAASEYAYRWHLPLDQWVNFAETDKPHSRNGSRRSTGAWPVPHLIGL